jgi:glucoamylase
MKIIVALLATQFQASLNHIVTNATMPDAKPGMVVASPSKSNPNYYYDWVRDTSLTMRSLTDYYAISHDPKIKSLILNWVDSDKRRQNLPTLTGLGEPKYNVNGTVYNDPWGRPQNDGPALRSLAMITLARVLMKEGQTDYVIKNLYHSVLPADSVIKKDLEYTAYHWRETSFDLWEEERGEHFYTLLAQYTAMKEGAIFAREFSDHGAAEFYNRTATEIGEKLIRDFKDNYIGIKATINRKKRSSLGYKSSNIDVAPLLALLHTYPYQNLFSLKDPFVLKYIQVLTETFQRIYTVNSAYPNLGVAIGRYPEDRYDGMTTSSLGNPWFLSTLALAEYSCLLNRGAKSTLAEKQFQRVLFHSGRSGSFSEQFNRESGYMQGAVELTWSHNSFLTATQRCGLLK